MINFQTPRSRRTEPLTHASRFRGGVLQPVSCHLLEQGEGGTLLERITLELDPIAGRLESQINVTFQTVFVPLLASDHFINQDYWVRGNAEHMRDRLENGNAIFHLEPEHEISRAMGVVPRSIGGVKKVSAEIRAAHGSAVTYLRRRLYRDAVEVDVENKFITPALLSSTILDRFNAVLDPEDRINGGVNIGGTQYIRGIGLSHLGTGATGSPNMRESDGSEPRNVTGWRVDDAASAGSAVMVVEEDPDRPGFPFIRAEFADKGADVALSDFYNAQKTDGFMREFRRIMDENPQFGDDVVSRIVHGLNIETGKEPFMLYETKKAFGKGVSVPTDGASMEQDVLFSHMAHVEEFAVPIPASEFGGMVITFVSVKPDEVLPAQPRPNLTRPRKGRNFLADEMKIDPEPVTVRDLDADCLPEDEQTVAFWVGPNHLERNYAHYNFVRGTDMEAVATKSAIWQYPLPLSVTPENVIYEPELDHYPFADQQADIVRCTVSSVLGVQTPMVFGPTPIERLEALDDAFFIEQETE